MDSNKWRRELDRFSEIKAMLTSIAPALEEQTSRQLRSLYDIFAKYSKLESDVSSAGMMKKRKLVSQMEKTEGDLNDNFMNLVRDFSDLFRKEQRDITILIPKLQAVKPVETKSVASVSFPSIGAGDMEDFER
ncbi:MAG: hypothetical protein ACTSUB_10450, partial [Candidatus Thorarchaeota archaeon]